MNYDEYGEVINGELTYKGIAEELASNAVIVGWSDGNGTHLDILFTLHALRYGDQIQGGIKPKSDLFVSIMRWGAFAFEIKECDTHAGYYEEKLGTRGPFGEATRDALAELLNGVRKLLAQDGYGPNRYAPRASRRTRVIPLTEQSDECVAYLAHLLG